MRRPHHRPAAPWFIALGLALGGCGGPEDGLPRQSVSGTVTLDGEPLKGGSITFTPKDQGRPDAVTAGAVILDGAYAIDRDAGPTPGTYLVSIFASTPSSGLAPGEAPGMPPKPSRDAPAIPERYNTHSTLVAEVSADGRNQFEYELKSE